LPALILACIATAMILLRHGQSEFNLHFTATRRDPGIVDPRLTELGHFQALEAARVLAGERIARIIVSPYTRALQTAAPIARSLGIKLLVNPLVRERFAFACDVGSPRTELERSWPEHDFSAIDEVWWPAIEEPANSVIGRAALFRAEMAALPDWADTLVISHWGFILCMTGKSVTNGEWLRCDPNGPAPEHITWRA
jgi:glucosyl-3-phosphoglycerate phosphatase